MNNLEAPANNPAATSGRVLQLVNDSAPRVGDELRVKLSTQPRTLIVKLNHECQLEFANEILYSGRGWALYC